MKIHQTIGIVAGVHAFAFLLIFANPGCSSTTKPQGASSAEAGGGAAPAAVPVAADNASAPLAPAGGESPGLVPVTGASAGGNVFYSPTRPNTAAAEALAPAAPAPEVTPAETYTVRGGDSLSRIAHRHHITVAELAEANNLRSGSVLHPGQKLLIPHPGRAAEAPAAAEAGARSTAGASQAAAGGEAGGRAAGQTKYVVKAGDKLSSIARRYGLTTGALAAENNISDPRKIRPGQVLIIPAAGSARHGAKHNHNASRPAAEAPAETPAAAPLEPVNPPAQAAPEAAPPAPSADNSVPIVPIVPADSGTAAPSSAPAQ